MSILARAVPPRATKGIDQEAMSSLAGYRGSYVPIEELQRWTGLQITPEVGLEIITAYQCVQFLANTYASIPTLFYRRREDGGKERADDHPMARTFTTAANPDMSAYDWKNVVKTHIGTWGNHYSEIVRNVFTGEVELWPMRPDRVEAYWKQGRKAYDYLHPIEGRKELNPERVLHLKALTTDGLVGLSPIAAMRRAMGLYRRAERYGESVFDNGARPAGMLTHPNTLSTPAIERLGKQMDALRGSGNAGKTVILEEGAQFKEIGFPPEDALMMGARLFQKREIAAGYGVTLGMLNDPEAEEDEDEESRKFMKRTLIPAFESFEQSVQLQVIKDDRYFVEFLADAYLRGDPKARSDAYAVMWEHGALNDDEWRKRENMDPLPDGLGEVYYRPANWVPLGEDPVAVGGDASRDTQFGQRGALVDQVTRAKTADWPKIDSPRMSQFDCPACGKLIARMAAPGTIGYCRGCREERTMEDGEVAA